ncbi:MAG: hypothetical protein QOI56_698 [Actinomycetota bacterium]|nr:hypothetical protein [Actinomycetota bacterium]
MPADIYRMNRTRMSAALLAALFVLAVGVGVAMGWGDRPVRDVVAADTTATTTTTVAPPTTTTTRPTTSTSSPPTTVPRTTTTRPPVFIEPPATSPPATSPPATDPPGTDPPAPNPPPVTTTVAAYDPVLCATINRDYAGDPNRIVYLQAWHCPPRFY